MACLATMPLHLALAVLIERARSKEAADSTSMVLTVLHIVNITLEILTPTITVWTSIEHPLPGMAAIFLPTILFLKLISYMLVNRELKHERDDAVLRGLGIDVPKSPRPAEDPAKESTDHALSDAADAMPFDPNAIKYPNNVTLGNAVYFWLAPTLCYQPVYPRTRRIRRSYMLKRLLEMLVVSIAIVVLTKQYALPTLVNSTAAMRDASWGKLLERLLKLSMISLYIWILSFFLFFHSFLSAFAELLRFGDRRFFGEWWNSTDFSEYWRLWNQPVSSWAKRHIYLPLIKNHSLSPFASQLIVFLVSAALHELIIGVPTKTVYGFAAGAMLLQVPMISLGRLLSAARERFGWRPQKEIIDTIGNLHFWMSFCIIGQPLVVMLYWFDWQRKTRAA